MQSAALETQDGAWGSVDELPEFGWDADLNLLFTYLRATAAVGRDMANALDADDPAVLMELRRRLTACRELQSLIGAPTKPHEFPLHVLDLVRLSAASNGLFDVDITMNLARIDLGEPLGSGLCALIAAVIGAIARDGLRETSRPAVPMTLSARAGEISLEFVDNRSRRGSANRGLRLRPCEHRGAATIGAVIAEGELACGARSTVISLLQRCSGDRARNSRRATG